jgi:ABC-type thiamine transport system ATPase subunit
MMVSLRVAEGMDTSGYKVFILHRLRLKILPSMCKSTTSDSKGVNSTLEQNLIATHSKLVPTLLCGGKAQRFWIVRC